MFIPIGAKYKTWYQVPRTRYLVSGTWYMVLRIYCPYGLAPDLYLTFLPVLVVGPLCPYQGRAGQNQWATKPISSGLYGCQEHKLLNICGFGWIKYFKAAICLILASNTPPPNPKGPTPPPSPWGGVGGVYEVFGEYLGYPGIKTN